MPKQNTKIAKQVAILKSLADETRLRIVLLLLREEKTVTEITKNSNRAQPTISLNLRVLEQAGLIYKERKGRHIYYSLHEQKVKKILDGLGFDRLRLEKLESGDES